MSETPLVSKRRFDSDSEEVEERNDYGSAVYHYPPHLQHGHFTSLEKLFFFTSSILLILLFIFVGLYARSSQVEDILPIPSKNQTQPKKLPCYSSNCIITAADILRDVDEELDPCDDFYAYTCKKWQHDHSIPPDQTRLDLTYLSQQTIEQRLSQLLTHPIPTQPKPIPHPLEPLDHQLIHQLQRLHQSCQTIKTEPDQIFDFLRTIPTGPDSLRYLTQHGLPHLFRLTDRLEPGLVITPDLIHHTFRLFEHDRSNEFGFGGVSPVAVGRRLVEFFQSLEPALPDQVWPRERLVELVPALSWIELDPVPVSASFLRSIGRALDRLDDRMWRLVAIWSGLIGLEDGLGEFGLAKVDCVGWVRDGLGPVASRFLRRSEPDLSLWLVELKSLLSKKNLGLEKDYVMEKLDRLRFEVGSDFISPNIDSPVALAEYFSDLEITDSFFHNLIQIKKHQAKHPSVHFNALTLKIQYKDDKLMIPPGLLEMPYFDPIRPSFLNLGMLGGLIVNEIMYGIHRESPKGVFKEIDECLNEQYKEFKSDTSRNFADQFLLIDELKDLNDTVSLPGIKWTNEQVAYIQHSRLFCSKTINTTSKNETPDNLRVNLPLMNSNHFSKVFKCKKGSFMNPIDNRLCKVI